MDAATAGLIGVVIGAFSSSFLTEYYKRYRDRRALAFALRGEIRAHLSAFPTLTKIFTNFADMAVREDPVPLFPFEPPPDPIYEKSVDKLGLLEGDFPERLAYFYARLNGLRRVLKLAGQNHYGDTGPDLARALNSALSQLEEIEPTAQRLIDELGAAAEPRVYVYARPLWQRTRVRFAQAPSASAPRSPRPP